MFVVVVVVVWDAVGDVCFCCLLLWCLIWLVAFGVDFVVVVALVVFDAVGDACCCLVSLLLRFSIWLVYFDFVCGRCCCGV